MHVVFERDETQWRNQVVELAVTSMDHFLQDFCRRDNEDDAAGPSSGGSAVL